MKSIKLVAFGLAVLLSLGAGIAKEQCLSCTTLTQYYFDGFNYVQVPGRYGFEYYCDNGITCTYYKPDPFQQPNYYVPCRSGTYTPVFLK